MSDNLISANKIVRLIFEITETRMHYVARTSDMGVVVKRRNLAEREIEVMSVTNGCIALGRLENEGIYAKPQMFFTPSTAKINKIDGVCVLFLENSRNVQTLRSSNGYRWKKDDVFQFRKRWSDRARSKAKHGLSKQENWKQSSYSKRPSSLFM